MTATEKFREHALVFRTRLRLKFLNDMDLGKDFARDIWKELGIGEIHIPTALQMRIDLGV